MNISVSLVSSELDSGPFRYPESISWQSSVSFNFFFFLLLLIIYKYKNTGNFYKFKQEILMIKKVLIEMLRKDVKGLFKKYFLPYLNDG